MNAEPSASHPPAPRSDDAPSGRGRLPGSAAWVALAVLASAAFFRITLLTPSLGGYDWVNHFHYYDWTRTCLTTYVALPLYMADALHTPHFLANPQSPIPGPLVWLLFLIPAGAYIKLLIVLYGAAGLIGMFALLRDEGVCREIALLAAVLFAFNGFFPAHIAAGHHRALGAWLFPATLLFFRRAARGDRTALWLAAAVNVLAIFEGSHHPFLWQNFFLAMFAGLTCVQEKSLRPARTWALLVLLTLALGAIKLLPMLAEFGRYAPDKRIGGLPPTAVLWSLVARGQGMTTAYPGLAFQHGSGWWEYGFYTGAVPLALIAAGLLAARRGWPLLLVGVFFLLISIDLRHAGAPVDAWSLVSHLPGWKTQRSPSRFLIVALFALTAVAAIGLQRLLDAARGRPRLHRALRAGAVALALGAAVDLHLQSRAWQRAGPGVEPASRSHLPRLLLFPAPGEGGPLIQEFGPDRFTVDVTTPARAHLVLLDEPAGGRDQWRVEGGPIDPIEGRLAVAVGPGETTIRFRYVPRFYHLGMAVSALSLLAGIGMLRGGSRRAAES